MFCVSYDSKMWSLSTLYASLVGFCNIMYKAFYHLCIWKYCMVKNYKSSQYVIKGFSWYMYCNSRRICVVQYRTNNCTNIMYNTKHNNQKNYICSCYSLSTELLRFQTSIYIFNQQKTRLIYSLYHKSHDIKLYINSIL